MDVSTKDFPDFVRCTGCGEAMARTDSAGHACPPTAQEQQDSDEESDAITVLERAAAATTAKDMLRAIHSYENIVKALWDNRVRRAEARFTPEILRKVAYNEILSLLNRTREMRQEQYDLNDALRAKGVPYVERMKRIDRRKIEWCDKEEAKLSGVLGSPFRVRPLREWFEEPDYVAARKLGMPWVVRVRLGEIIIVNR